jgi:hypothetical protein
LWPPVSLVGISFLPLKKTVIFIDMTLLNPNMATKLFNHRPFLKERPINSKTAFVVSAGETRKVNCGFRTRMGTGFNRSWGDYERRQRLFVAPYRIALGWCSG